MEIVISTLLLSYLNILNQSKYSAPGNPHESLVGLDLVLVVAVEEGDDAANRVVQPDEVRRRLARRYGALEMGRMINTSDALKF